MKLHGPLTRHRARPLRENHECERESVWPLESLSAGEMFLQTCDEEICPQEAGPPAPYAPASAAPPCGPGVRFHLRRNGGVSLGSDGPQSPFGWRRSWGSPPSCSPLSPGAALRLPNAARNLPFSGIPSGDRVRSVHRYRTPDRAVCGPLCEAPRLGSVGWQVPAGTVRPFRS